MRNTFKALALSCFVSVGSLTTTDAQQIADVDLTQVSNMEMVCTADKASCAFSFFISAEYGADEPAVGAKICLSKGMLVTQTVEGGLEIRQMYTRSEGTYGIRAGMVMCHQP